MDRVLERIEPMIGLSGVRVWMKLGENGADDNNCRTGSTGSTARAMRPSPLA